MTAIVKSPNGGNGGDPHVRAGPIPERALIYAKNIMTTGVVTVGPDKAVHDIARLLSERHISAVPVVDRGEIVGIVTEGDLLRRAELGTDAEKTTECSDEAIVKSQGKRARDIMTPDVVSVTEETTLAEIAELMEAKRIRRVPVVRNDRLVGVVSRADIVRALAERPADPHAPSLSDDDIIRYRVIETLMNIPGASVWLTNVSVCNGIVSLSGAVEDESALEPSRRAVEKLANVRGVDDHRSTLQPY